MKEKTLSVLLVTHKELPYALPKKPYLPLLAGAYIYAEKETQALPSFVKKYQRDDEKENISVLNAYFSELTALYYAYRNLDTDYVGLVHYRRFFAKKQNFWQKCFSKKEKNLPFMEEKEMLHLLEQGKIILPKKRNYCIESLYNHYAHTFDEAHLKKLRKVIEEQCSEDLPLFDKVLSRSSGYMWNMYVMPKQLSDAYCAWLFPLLFELYELMDLSSLSAFEKRLFGRLSELLFNVWLEKQKISIAEVDVHYLGREPFFKKLFAFLLAKFFGKKYTKSF